MSFNFEIVMNGSSNVIFAQMKITQQPYVRGNEWYTRPQLLT